MEPGSHPTLDISGGNDASRSVRRVRGFTIVELLIVIVVIAILAAITIVAYNGAQNRAMDARRMQDFSEMEKALRLYAVDNNSFPASVPNPGSSTWEVSTDPGFLGSLNAYDDSHVFADPRNTSTSRYWYHTFGAGAYGCPVSMGPYYVLQANGMQNQASSGGSVIQTNGCTGQTLFTGAYLTDSHSYMYFGFL